MANVYHPNKDGTVTIDQQAQMTLNVAGRSNPIDLHLRAMLEQSGKLKNFTFSFHSSFYRMHAIGQAKGKSVVFTLTTGSATIHDSVELSAAPLISTIAKGLSFEKGDRAGGKIQNPLV